jgi:hypothetical protein
VFAPPDGLYKPVILERGVDLSAEKQFIYDLEYEYFDYYDVGARFNSNNLPSSLNDRSEPYVFNGRMLIELIADNDTVVRKKVVEIPLAYTISENTNYYSGIVFDRFPLPANARYFSYRIRITVLEGDAALNSRPASLYISVSNNI